MQGDYVQREGSPLPSGKIFKDLWRSMTERLSRVLEMQEPSNRGPGKLARMVGKVMQYITTAAALALLLQPRLSHSYPAISIYVCLPKLDTS